MSWPRHPDGAPRQLARCNHRTRKAHDDSDAGEPRHRESPQFPAPRQFAAQAVATAELYDEGRRPDRFLGPAGATTGLVHPWTEVLDWSNAPFAKWFVGGELNVAYNCVDRHVENGLGSRTAIIFEPESGGETITYEQLQRRVSQAANALTGLGVAAGDRVAIYMPMIPQAVVAMLACARIGAPHSVIFGGFSAEACAAASTTRRRKWSSPATGSSDAGPPCRSNRPWTKRSSTARRWRRCLWSGAPATRCSGTRAATSGGTMWSRRPVTSTRRNRSTPSTRCSSCTPRARPERPRGILHTSGGYLTQVSYTHGNVFDLKPETDVYWCTADIGWVTGHSYIVYGPLSNGATQVIYEGTPDTPHKGRWWEIIEKHKVSILYTAPTAIRTFMKWGRRFRSSTTCPRCGCSARWVSRSTRRPGCGIAR